MMASPSTDSEVDFGSLGPVFRSAMETASSIWLRSWDRCHTALPMPSGSLDYFVLLDGSPLSLWRSREEPAP